MFASCLLVLTLSLGGTAQSAPKHDRAFWRQIVQADGAVPAGMSADALSEELSAMLGERDPELRDDIAYTLLATWLAVKPQISDAQALRLAKAWLGNINHIHLDESTDAVLRRSFSALSLAAAVARDNDKSFLRREDFREILDVALVYFFSETDTRGFDPAFGWVHATAHTADLFRYLSRSRFLTPADQGKLFQVITTKVKTTGVAWAYGEDERIGRVLLALVARPDVDWTAYETFVADVAKLARFPEKPAPDTLARFVNARHLLTSTCALLDATPDTPATARARKALVDAIAGKQD